MTDSPMASQAAVVARVELFPSWVVLGAATLIVTLARGVGERVAVAIAGANDLVLEAGRQGDDAFLALVLREVLLAKLFRLGRRRAAAEGALHPAWQASNLSRGTNRWDPGCNVPVPSRTWAGGWAGGPRGRRQHELACQSQHRAWRASAWQGDSAGGGGRGQLVPVDDEEQQKYMHGVLLEVRHDAGHDDHRVEHTGAGTWRETPLAAAQLAV